MRSRHASYLLGYDCGSSSIKAALLEIESGKRIASASSPDIEMPIISRQAGWAEQDPEMWWKHLVAATAKLRKIVEERGLRDAFSEIGGIGISYQMHGLVLLDKDRKTLRPSIIWCDSRAVEIGNRSYRELGRQVCLSKTKNPPGNFTATRFRWVIEHEPEIARRTASLMLPGDYLAFRMTDEVGTTSPGLSEMILWDFESESASEHMLSHLEISSALLPPVLPTFGRQGELTQSAAQELGVPSGTPVAYRSGDQPNNAFSLGAVQHGDVAATAGTSGVVYAVSQTAVGDPQGRVNTFVHVNHSPDKPHYGILLCVNGCGILYSWLRKILSGGQPLESYDVLNSVADEAPIGSNGLVVLPYGNGAERSLGNEDLGASLHNLRFTSHSTPHLIRAAQEGIAFSLCYGMQIMRELGVAPLRLKTGTANLMLSPIFRNALAGASGCSIDILDTDGAEGAARAAGVGTGIYASIDESFHGLTQANRIEPQNEEEYRAAYERWLEVLTGKQLEHENRRIV